MAAKKGGGSKKSTSSGSGKSISAHVDKNSSLSVDQIENGFLVTESGYTGKGKNQQWYNKKWFSKTNPIKISGFNSGANGGGGGSRSGGGMRFGGKK